MIEHFDFQKLAGSYQVARYFHIGLRRRVYRGQSYEIGIPFAFSPFIPDDGCELRPGLFKFANICHPQIPLGREPLPISGGVKPSLRYPSRLAPEHSPPSPPRYSAIFR
jgi:hypothetical protein